MRDCLGEVESRASAPPVDDAMMSMENLAAAAVLCCGRERPTTSDGKKGERRRVMRSQPPKSISFGSRTFVQRLRVWPSARLLDVGG